MATSYQYRSMGFVLGQEPNEPPKEEPVLAVGSPNKRKNRDGDHEAQDNPRGAKRRKIDTTISIRIDDPHKNDSGKGSKGQRSGTPEKKNVQGPTSIVRSGVSITSRDGRPITVRLTEEGHKSQGPPVLPTLPNLSPAPPKAALEEGELPDSDEYESDGSSGVRDVLLKGGKVNDDAADLSHRDFSDSFIPFDGERSVRGSKRSVPWGKAQTLSEEIQMFYEWMKPTEAEMSARQDLTNKIFGICNDVFGDEATPTVFGSFSTGLCLPTSDLDIVILTGHRPGSHSLKALFRLSTAIEKSRVFSAPPKMQLITGARVPLIKLEDLATNIQIDISFNVENGPKNTKVINRFLKSFPEARPLIFVIKTFLSQRNLNEVYTGGIGSYALFILVISFLQHREKEDHEDRELDLGKLLLDFFELYGSFFNYFNTGISINNGGSYFPKMSKGWDDNERPFLLSIEDPNDADNDVSRSSYQILMVRESFRHAFAALRPPVLDQSQEQSNIPKPTLSSIILPDEITATEDFRSNIEILYRDVVVTNPLRSSSSSSSSSSRESPRSSSSSSSRESPRSSSSRESPRSSSSSSSRESPRSSSSSSSSSRGSSEKKKSRHRDHSRHEDSFSEFPLLTSESPYPSSRRSPKDSSSKRHKSPKDSSSKRHKSPKDYRERGSSKHSNRV